MSQAGVMGWVFPVCSAIGGVLLLLALRAVMVFRRHRRTQQRLERPQADRHRKNHDGHEAAQEPRYSANPARFKSDGWPNASTGTGPFTSCAEHHSGVSQESEYEDVELGDAEFGPQYADVELHCADVRPEYADVEPQYADVEPQYAEVGVTLHV